MPFLTDNNSTNVGYDRDPSDIVDLLTAWPLWLTVTFDVIKPPPPVGAGGGYMFSGRPSVRASVRASVIHVVVLCFRDISSIC